LTGTRLPAPEAQPMAGRTVARQPARNA